MDLLETDEKALRKGHSRRMDLLEHELERDKFELEKSKHQLEMARLANEYRQNERDYVDQLMHIASQLSRKQDGINTVIRRPKKDTFIITKGVPLNAHEEDIYNYSLILSKCLIAKDYDFSRPDQENSVKFKDKLNETRGNR